MPEIKCLENYNLLKELLLKGERGSACYFSAKLNISRRTFFRHKKCMERMEGLIIRYNKAGDSYYLE
jgi:hypothetical protein